MDILSNPAVVISMFLCIVSIGIWLFNKLYTWIEKLNDSMTALTSIVAVLGEKYDNHDEEIKGLKAQVANIPTVKYRK